MRPVNTYTAYPDPSIDSSLITIQISLDENVTTIERNVMTLLEMISKVGGLMGILLIFAKFII